MIILCVNNVFILKVSDYADLFLLLLQLLDTLPVCKDFKLGLCQRPTCKYVHVIEGKQNSSLGLVMSLQGMK